MIPWARPPDGSRRKIAARGPARASTTKPPTPGPGGLGVRPTITSPGMPGGYLCAYRERAAHDNAMKHERRELAASRPAAAALAQIFQVSAQIERESSSFNPGLMHCKKTAMPSSSYSRTCCSIAKSCQRDAPKSRSMAGRCDRRVSRLRYMVSQLYILNVQARRPSRRR